MQLADGPTVFGQQGHVAGVRAPHHVLHLSNLDCGKQALLLHIKQCDAIGIAQQQGARPGVEDFFAARHLNLFRYFVF